MRPIVLTLQAFGPYGDFQRVDFETLDQAGVFLLTGPTGAGKTSLFDGICYALYGESSGAERGPEALRSHHAQGDLLTEVTFTFSLRGHTYKVVRAPKQERPKAKRQGVTVYNGHAQLHYEDQSLPPVVGIREVNETVYNLLQVNADQFRQIIMIPQGAFRQLLVSDSLERQEILSKLFGTQAYERVAAKLQEDAQGLRQALDAVLSHVQMTVKQLKSSRWFNPEVFWTQEVPDLDQLLPLLSEGLVALESEVKQGTEAVANCNLMVYQAQGTYEGQRQLQEALAALADEKNLQAQRLLTKGDMDRLDQQLALQPQLMQILSLKRQCEAHLTQLGQLEGQLAQAIEKHRGAEVEMATAKEELDALTGAQAVKARQARQREGEVLSIGLRHSQNLKGYQLQIGGLSKDLESLNGQLQLDFTALKDLSLEGTLGSWDAHASEASLSEWREAIQGQRLEVQRALDVALARRQGLDQGFRRLEALEAQARAIAERHKGLEALRVEERTAQSQWLWAQQRYHQHQAAALAALLAPGAPCPVCGSTDHPAVAQVPQDPLGDLEALQDAYQVLRDQVLKASEDIRHRQSQWDLDLKDLHPEATSDLKSTHQWLMDQSIENTEDHLKHSQRLDRLTRADSSLSTLLRGLGEAAIVREKLSLLQDQATKDQAALEALGLTLTDDLEQRLEAIKEAQVEDQRLLDHWKSAYQQGESKVVRYHEQAGLYRKQLEEVHGQVLSLQAQRDSKLSELEITLEVAQALTLEAQGLKEAKAQVDAYKEALASSRQRIKDLEAQVQGREPQALEPLAIAITRAEAERDAALEVQRSLLALRNHYQEQEGRLQGLKDHYRQRAAEYQMIGGLSELVRGNNSKRLSLERYVLTYFMDGVLDKANRRLVQLTESRYQLVRLEEAQRRGKQAGLELAVLDAYTGTERHVKTLSGGEAFKASLALALGLAEVVETYAGGIRLDTLLVDEGFGTLDPESLDAAIQCLLDLRETGRLVGIISHVPELKERILAQVRIEPTLVGSKISIV